MAGIGLVSIIEGLVCSVNTDGIIGIALRNRQQLVKMFKKIVLCNSDSDNWGPLKKVFDFLNKKGDNGEARDELLEDIAKRQELQIAMEAINLCATCLGFAVMYAKLEKMSDKLNQVMSIIKEQNGVQTNYEYKKVLSEYSNMLDCRKTRKYYTEEQMRKLVDDEYNVLNLLIDSLLKDITADQDDLIVSIFSLAAMLTVSIKYFDEMYYFNNIEVIGDGEVWHSSHNSWMSVFERIKGPKFIKKLQDHALFDLELSTKEVDSYYFSLAEQVQDYVEEITDNQALIMLAKDKDTVENIRGYINEEVKNEIEESFESVKEAKDNPQLLKAYKDAMKKMALEA